MTRIHDGSPTPRLQSETAVEESAASGEKDEPSCAMPGDSATPRFRGVFVSYDEFMQRRQLRRRVKAAFERSQAVPPLAPR